MKFIPLALGPAYMSPTRCCVRLNLALIIFASGNVRAIHLLFPHDLFEADPAFLVAYSSDAHLHRIYP